MSRASFEYISESRFNVDGPSGNYFVNPASFYPEDGRKLAKTLPFLEDLEKKEMEVEWTIPERYGALPGATLKITPRKEKECWDLKTLGMPTVRLAIQLKSLFDAAYKFTNIPDEGPKSPTSLEETHLLVDMLETLAFKPEALDYVIFKPMNKPMSKQKRFPRLGSLLSRNHTKKK